MIFVFNILSTFPTFCSVMNQVLISMFFMTKKEVATFKTAYLLLQTSRGGGGGGPSGLVSPEAKCIHCIFLCATLIFFLKPLPEH